MNILGIVVYLAWIVGITLIFYNGLKAIQKRRVREVFKKEDKPREVLRILYKNKEFGRCRKYIEERASFAGTAWSFTTFLIYSFISGTTGIIIALTFLKNPVAALPLALALGLGPWLYLHYFANKKEALLEQQFIPAIQYFIAEYGSLPNIVSALNNILSRMEYPLEDELNRLILDFNSGKNPEEALFSFAVRINSRWAYRFAHILNLRLQKGININTMLFNLYMDMKTKVVQDRERRSETAGVRAESLILYLCIPGVYYLATKISPQSHYLLTETPTGQKAVLLVVIMVLCGVVATLKLGSCRTR